MGAVNGRMIFQGCGFYHFPFNLILLHSERPKLHTILAFLSAIELSQLNARNSVKTFPKIL